MYRLSALFASLGLFFTAVNVAAHHSLPALFDMSSRVDVSGVVTEFQFISPHAYILVDVTDDAGNTEVWQLETYPPGMLVRKGLTPATLQPGDMISANGIPARDDLSLMRLLMITMPDGEQMQIQ